MTKSRLHVHQCVDCGTPVDCDGALEQNHDGWPEVVCDWVDRFHQDPICESCHDERDKAAAVDVANDWRLYGAD